MSDTSANDEVEQGMQKGPEEVAVEQDMTQGKQEEIKTHA
jgi:hypothetical protein